MTQWFSGFLFLLGGDGGCGEGAGCRAGTGPGFRFFILQIIMKIKILNSIKTKGP